MLTERKDSFISYEQLGLEAVNLPTPLYVGALLSIKHPSYLKVSLSDLLRHALVMHWYRFSSGWAASLRHTLSSCLVDREVERDCSCNVSQGLLVSFGNNLK